MTPADALLNPDVFSSGSLTLYRLAKAEYANLSGAGAALYPGRWNRPGQEAIYTSLDPSTPVLERLVHTPKYTIPKNLAMMQILLHGDVAEFSSALPNPSLSYRSGANVRIYPSLVHARTSLFFDPDLNILAAGIRYGPINGPGLIAVAVPSVIVPAWNVVLYPQVDGFWDHVSLKNVETFSFDPRLFPETAT